MFSVRIVTTDHYVTSPIPGLDVHYNEQRASEVKKVPVVRIFGATPAGQKTCMHVHSVFPYLYVPYDGTTPWDRYQRQFATSLDKAINVAQGHGNSNLQHVYKIVLVTGRTMYGYQDKEEQFLKIYLYNPSIIRKAADLLLGGAVMNKSFQPHESHIPYTLQLLIDYNLYGMNMINVAAVKFRRRLQNDNEDVKPMSSQDTLSQGSSQGYGSEPKTPTSFTSLLNRSGSMTPSNRVWQHENIPSELYLDGDVERMSTCELEVDVVAADIQNRLEANANESGGNPGLAALWEDERQRRRDRGESTDIAPPTSQERENIEVAESETILRERLHQILQDLQPYMDSQSDTEMDLSQDEDGPATQASTVDLHLSQDGSMSSQDTMMLDLEEEQEAGEPIVSLESIKRVVSHSQSFCENRASLAKVSSQDKSLVDILAALAEDETSVLSQEAVVGAVALEDQDSALSQRSQPRDQELDLEEQQEILEMSQIWDDTEQCETEAGDNHNLSGMDDSWVDSQFDIKTSSDGEKHDAAADDDADSDDSDAMSDIIPQYDGPIDDKPSQADVKQAIHKRLGMRGPVFNMSPGGAAPIGPYAVQSNLPPQYHQHFSNFRQRAPNMMQSMRQMGNYPHGGTEGRGQAQWGSNWDSSGMYQSAAGGMGYQAPSSMQQSPPMRGQYPGQGFPRHCLGGPGSQLPDNQYGCMDQYQRGMRYNMPGVNNMRPTGYSGSYQPKPRYEMNPTMYPVPRQSSQSSMAQGLDLFDDPPMQRQSMSLGQTQGTLSAMSPFEQQSLPGVGGDKFVHSPQDQSGYLVRRPESGGAMMHQSMTSDRSFNPIVTTNSPASLYGIDKDPIPSVLASASASMSSADNILSATSMENQSFMSSGPPLPNTSLSVAKDARQNTGYIVKRPGSGDFLGQSSQLTETCLPNIGTYQAGMKHSVMSKLSPTSHQQPSTSNQSRPPDLFLKGIPSQSQHVYRVQKPSHMPSSPGSAQSFAQNNAQNIAQEPVFPGSRHGSSSDLLSPTSSIDFGDAFIEHSTKDNTQQQDSSDFSVTKLATDTQKDKSPKSSEPFMGPISRYYAKKKLLYEQISPPATPGGPECKSSKLPMTSPGSGPAEPQLSPLQKLLLEPSQAAVKTEQRSLSRNSVSSSTSISSDKGGGIQQNSPANLLQKTQRDDSVKVASSHLSPGSKLVTEPRMDSKLYNLLATKSVSTLEKARNKEMSLSDSRQDLFPDSILESPIESKSVSSMMPTGNSQVEINEGSAGDSLSSLFNDSFDGVKSDFVPQADNLRCPSVDNKNSMGSLVDMENMFANPAKANTNFASLSSLESFVGSVTKDQEFGVNFSKGETHHITTKQTSLESSHSFLSQLSSSDLDDIDTPLFQPQPQLPQPPIQQSKQPQHFMQQNRNLNEYNFTNWPEYSAPRKTRGAKSHIPGTSPRKRGRPPLKKSASSPAGSGLPSIPRAPAAGIQGAPVEKRKRGRPRKNSESALSSRSYASQSHRMAAPQQYQPYSNVKPYQSSSARQQFPSDQHFQQMIQAHVSQSHVQVNTPQGGASHCQTQLPGQIQRPVNMQPQSNLSKDHISQPQAYNQNRLNQGAINRSQSVSGSAELTSPFGQDASTVNSFQDLASLSQDQGSLTHFTDPSGDLTDSLNQSNSPSLASLFTSPDTFSTFDTSMQSQPSDASNKVSQQYPESDGSSYSQFPQQVQQSNFPNQQKGDGDFFQQSQSFQALMSNEDFFSSSNSNLQNQMSTIDASQLFQDEENMTNQQFLNMEFQQQAKGTEMDDACSSRNPGQDFRLNTLQSIRHHDTLVHSQSPSQKNDSKSLNDLIRYRVQPLSLPCPSYTYRFHVPSPVYKRLKYKAKGIDLPAAQVVRMHPKDARKYSLMKIGNEVVHLKKLTVEDIQTIQSEMKNGVNVESLQSLLRVVENTNIPSSKSIIAELLDNSNSGQEVAEADKSVSDISAPISDISAPISEDAQDIERNRIHSKRQRKISCGKEKKAKSMFRKKNISTIPHLKRYRAGFSYFGKGSIGRGRNVRVRQLHPVLGPDYDDNEDIILKDVSLNEASNGVLTPIKSRTPIAGRSPAYSGGSLLETQESRESIDTKLKSLVEDELGLENQQIFQENEFEQDMENSENDSSSDENCDLKQETCYMEVNIKKQADKKEIIEKPSGEYEHGDVKLSSGTECSINKQADEKEMIEKPNGETEHVDVKMTDDIKVESSEVKTSDEDVASLPKSEKESDEDVAFLSKSEKESNEDVASSSKSEKEFNHNLETDDNFRNRAIKKNASNIDSDNLKAPKELTDGALKEIVSCSILCPIISNDEEKQESITQSKSKPLNQTFGELDHQIEKCQTKTESINVPCDIQEKENIKESVEKKYDEFQSSGVFYGKFKKHFETMAKKNSQKTCSLEEENTCSGKLNSPSSSSELPSRPNSRRSSLALSIDSCFLADSTASVKRQMNPNGCDSKVCSKRYKTKSVSSSAGSRSSRSSSLEKNCRPKSKSKKKSKRKKKSYRYDSDSDGIPGVDYIVTGKFKGVKALKVVIPKLKLKGDETAVDVKSLVNADIVKKNEDDLSNLSKTEGTTDLYTVASSSKRVSDYNSEFEKFLATHVIDNFTENTEIEDAVTLVDAELDIPCKSDHEETDCNHSIQTPSDSTSTEVLQVAGKDEAHVSHDDKGMEADEDSGAELEGKKELNCSCSVHVESCQCKLKDDNIFVATTTGVKEISSSSSDESDNQYKKKSLKNSRRKTNNNRVEAKKKKKGTIHARMDRAFCGKKRSRKKQNLLKKPSKLMSTLAVLHDATLEQLVLSQSYNDSDTSSVANMSPFKKRDLSDGESALKSRQKLTLPDYELYSTKTDDFQSAFNDTMYNLAYYSPPLSDKNCSSPPQPLSPEELKKLEIMDTKTEKNVEYKEQAMTLLDVMKSVNPQNQNKHPLLGEQFYETPASSVETLKSKENSPKSGDDAQCQLEDAQESVIKTAVAKVAPLTLKDIKSYCLEENEKNSPKHHNTSPPDLGPPCVQKFSPRAERTDELGLPPQLTPNRQMSGCDSSSDTDRASSTKAVPSIDNSTSMPPFLSPCRSPHLPVLSPRAHSPPALAVAAPNYIEDNMKEILEDHIADTEVQHNEGKKSPCSINVIHSEQFSDISDEECCGNSASTTKKATNIAYRLTIGQYDLKESHDSTEKQDNFTERERKLKEVQEFEERLRKSDENKNNIFEIMAPSKDFFVQENINLHRRDTNQSMSMSDTIDNPLFRINHDQQKMSIPVNGVSRLHDDDRHEQHVKKDNAFSVDKIINGGSDRISSVKSDGKFDKFGIRSHSTSDLYEFERSYLQAYQSVTIDCQSANRNNSLILAKERSSLLPCGLDLTNSNTSLNGAAEYASSSCLSPQDAIDLSMTSSISSGGTSAPVPAASSHNVYSSTGRASPSAEKVNSISSQRIDSSKKCLHLSQYNPSRQEAVSHSFSSSQLSSTVADLRHSSGNNPYPLKNNLYRSISNGALPIKDSCRNSEFNTNAGLSHQFSFPSHQSSIFSQSSLFSSRNSSAYPPITGAMGINSGDLFDSSSLSFNSSRGCGPPSYTRSLSESCKSDYSFITNNKINSSIIRSVTSIGERSRTDFHRSHAVVPVNEFGSGSGRKRAKVQAKGSAKKASAKSKGSRGSEDQEFDNHDDNSGQHNRPEGNQTRDYQQTNRCQVITPLIRPPSREDIRNTAGNHGLVLVQGTKAFYGKPKDSTGERPRESGGEMLKVVSSRVKDLPEFESMCSATNLKDWRAVLCSHGSLLSSQGGLGTILDQLDREPALKYAMTGDQQVIITPCQPPPSVKCVQKWNQGRQLLKKTRKQTLQREMCNNVKLEEKDKGNISKIFSSNDADTDIRQKLFDDDKEVDMSEMPGPSDTSNVEAIDTKTEASKAGTYKDKPQTAAELTAESPDITRTPRRRLDDGGSSLLHSTPTLRRASTDLFETECTPIAMETRASTAEVEESKPGPSFVTPKRKRPMRRLSTNTDTALRKAILTSQVKHQFSTPSLQKDVSQIEGPTPKNSFGFKVSQQNFQDAKALHEFQYITILSVEVHAETRGDLRPDPEFDRLQAIFYTIFNDVPPEQGARNLTGVFLVDPESANQEASKKSASQDANCHSSNQRAERSAEPQPGPSRQKDEPPKVKGHSHSTLLQKSGLLDLDVTYVKDEIELLNSFADFVKRWDPDILVGYEIQMLSWGYILQRASTLSLNLTPTISRIPSSKTSSRHSAEQDEWGADHHTEIHIAGRIVLNLWRLLRHELTLNVYTFENVAFHALHQRIPLYSFKDLTAWYRHRTHLHRWKVVKHYVTRVKAVVDIMDQLDLIGRTSEFARVFGIEFYHVLSRGSQYRVESMMLRVAKPMNQIPVSPSVNQRARMKAPECIQLTLEPESRFYTDPVVVLDFQSLYPSIMIAYNYCFSTCLGRLAWFENAHEGAIEFGCTSLNLSPSTIKKLENDITISPNGVVFCKQSVKRGVLPVMVEEILTTRLMVKKAMGSYKGDKVLTRLLHARQMGLKLIANVTYGYTGANFSGRMPCIEVADSIVRKARETLERSIKLVEETPRWGAKVVYGDTDSMFLLMKGKSKDEAFTIGQEIADTVTKLFPQPIKLKFEKVYLPCVLQTKKRYVGFMYETRDQKEPVYDAKGIETVRRDSCAAVSKILERSIKLLFTSRDVSQLKAYIQQQCQKVMEGTVSIQDFVFAKEYRGMAGYKPAACVPAHEIAKKLLRTDRRSEPRVGERVPYVIVYGSPGLPLIQLVRQPLEVLQDPSVRLNAVYYITKQILPPLNRFLLLLGVDVFSWYQEMPHTAARAMVHTSLPDQAKKGTISMYFTTSACPICESQTKQPVCGNCMQDPQLVCATLNSNITAWDRVQHHLQQICGTCTGSSEIASQQSCVSLDCPILHRMYRSRADMSKAQHYRDILTKVFK